VDPNQVKNIYTGLVQNDSLRNRLSICESAAIKFDSLIRHENKKTVNLMIQVNDLNSEIDRDQVIANKNMAELTSYERVSPIWFITCALIGFAGGIYLGNL
jgi:hypothetical protein